MHIYTSSMEGWWLAMFSNLVTTTMEVHWFHHKVPVRAHSIQRPPSASGALANAMCIVTSEELDQGLVETRP